MRPKLQQWCLCTAAQPPSTWWQHGSEEVLPKSCGRRRVLVRAVAELLMCLAPLISFFTNRPNTRSFTEGEIQEPVPTYTI